MFDYALNASRDRSTTARWTTTIVSGVAHGAVLMTLGISALYATDTMPEPRAMLTFVTTAALPPSPPPPPPAPAAAPEPTRPRTVKKVVARIARPQPLQPLARRAVRAPMTAPDGISPETGLEGGASAGSVDAGFEERIPGGVIGGIVGGIDRLPPPPPPPAAPVRIGGEITAPRLVHRVNPDYPLIAQRAQIEGVVILEATVNPRGQVEAVRVLRSHALLEHAAIEAVRQWAYEPLLLNGEPVPFVLTVTVSFSLADAGHESVR
jgi:protein TonB